MKLVAGRIELDEIGLGRRKGVHMAVEHQAWPSARGAGQARQQIVAVREQADAPDRKAFGLKPVLEPFRHSAFVAHRTIDVAEVERQPNQFVAIDARNDIIGH